jgi:hypothetical protein
VRRLRKRKRRTREHVIADLAVNHVERAALLCGFSIERVQRDYGVDLIIFTYTESGEVQSGCIFVQVKATEHPRWVRGHGELSFSLERAHLRAWLQEVFPFVLIVYDASRHRAYWAYIQRDLAYRRDAILRSRKRSCVVRIPRQQTLTTGAMRRFDGFRERIMREVVSIQHG